MHAFSYLSLLRQGFKNLSRFFSIQTASSTNHQFQFVEQSKTKVARTEISKRFGIGKALIYYKFLSTVKLLSYEVFTFSFDCSLAAIICGPEIIVKMIRKEAISGKFYGKRGQSCQPNISIFLYFSPATDFIECSVLLKTNEPS